MDQDTKATSSGSFGQTVLVGIGVLALMLATYRILAPAPAEGASSGETPAVFKQNADLRTAMARADASDRVVVAVASANWCGPCRRYKGSALADERVASWLEENAEAVMVDVTSGSTPDAESLGVRSIPATYVMRPDGMILASRVGSIDADELLGWLDDVVAR